MNGVRVGPRLPLLRLGALLACTVIVACDGDAPEVGAGTGVPDQERPNVLVLVLDTVRADRCSFGGNARDTTPYLDTLAAESVVFENCWTPCSWTGPAHASLFTGLRPENHGFRRDVRPYLDDSARTLAERFGAVGYATAAITNNPNAGRYVGLDQGFGFYREMHEVRELHVAEVGGRHALPDTAPTLVHPPAEVGHGIALDWIREQVDGGQPFFVFVNDMEAHLPYVPPTQFEERFVDAATPEERRAWARSLSFPVTTGACLGEVPLEPWQYDVLGQLYDAEIAYLDAQLETFLEPLRKDGVLDDTVVVVTSDHGENLGEYGLVDHVLSVHSTLLRVPLMIRYPRRLDAGARHTDVVRLEDVAPTLLELCGLAADAEMDGESLLGDLSGRHAYALLDRLPDQEVQDLARTFPEADDRPLLLGQRSVFDGRHQLIRRIDGRMRLYDLGPGGEMERDLVPEGGPVLERMRGLLDRVYPLRGR